jgi:hypothetical protein
MNAVLVSFCVNNLDVLILPYMKDKASIHHPIVLKGKSSVLRVNGKQFPPSEGNEQKHEEQVLGFKLHKIPVDTRL